MGLQGRRARETVVLLRDSWIRLPLLKHRRWRDGSGPLALTVTDAPGDWLLLMLSHQMRVSNLALRSVPVMQNFIDPRRHGLVEIQARFAEPVPAGFGGLLKGPTHLGHARLLTIVVPVLLSVNEEVQECPLIYD
jgi:hypothetical protein